MTAASATVVPYEGRWGISIDGEVVATAGRKRDAQNLARAATRTLRERPRSLVVVARESRSFADDEE